MQKYGLENVDRLFTHLRVAGHRILKTQAVEIVAGPAAVVVSQVSGKRAIPVSGERIDETQTLHTPLVDPPLVPGRLLLQREGLVLDDAQATIRGDIGNPVAACDRVDLVVRDPPLVAKVVKLSLHRPNRPTFGTHPIVTVKSRGHTGCVLVAEALSTGDGAPRHSTQLAHASIGCDKQTRAEGQ